MNGRYIGIVLFYCLRVVHRPLRKGRWWRQYSNRFSCVLEVNWKKMLEFRITYLHKYRQRNTEIVIFIPFRARISCWTKPFSLTLFSFSLLSPLERLSILENNIRVHNYDTIRPLTNVGHCLCFRILLRKRNTWEIFMPALFFLNSGNECA